MFELIKITHSDYALTLDGNQIAAVKHVSDVAALKRLIQQSNGNAERKEYSLSQALEDIRRLKDRPQNRRGPWVITDEELDAVFRGAEQ